MWEFLSKRAKDHNYVEKKEEESGNITYIYDEKHVKERNKTKAKKLAKLAKSISNLRKELKKDMDNSDPKIYVPALAVALIDETYERVGNRYSAKDMKHYGVTTWLKKHVSFSGSTATFKYVGKSGVKQNKTVSTSKIVSKLKELTKNKSPNDPIFEVDDYLLNDNLVNQYLRQFDITAKDIRGWHANEETKKALKKFTPAKDEKERKKDFKEAIEEAAKIVGHEPNTLKNQYLVPGFEEKYISKGEIIGKTASIKQAEIKLPQKETKEIWEYVKNLYAQRLFFNYDNFQRLTKFQISKELRPFYEKLHKDTSNISLFLLNSSDYLNKEIKVYQFNYEAKFFKPIIFLISHIDPDSLNTTITINHSKREMPLEDALDLIQSSLLTSLMKLNNLSSDESIVELNLLKNQIKSDAKDQKIRFLNKLTTFPIYPNTWNLNVNPEIAPNFIQLHITETDLPFLGSWEENSYKLTISLSNYLSPLSTNEYKNFKAHILETIIHELSHMMQTLVSWSSQAKSQSAGLPKTKSRTKHYNPSGFLLELNRKINSIENKLIPIVSKIPYLQRQEKFQTQHKVNTLSLELQDLRQKAHALRLKHPLRDIEFYPILQDEVSYFKRDVLPNFPKSSIPNAIRAYISLPSPFQDYIKPSPFFENLKDFYPDKFKLAISYFVKNIL